MATHADPARTTAFCTQTLWSVSAWQVFAASDVKEKKHKINVSDFSLSPWHRMNILFPLENTFIFLRVIKLKVRKTFSHVTLTRLEGKTLPFTSHMLVCFMSPFIK